MSIGDEEKFVGYELIEMYNLYLQLLQSKTRSRLMNVNLTQWRTLMSIRFSPDQSQSKLSRTVGIDPSSMTPIIDFFEYKGWVKRHRSAHNRSAHCIRMTPKGAKAYAEIEKEIINAEALFTELLGEKDRTKLYNLLHRLTEAVAEKL